jgi:hypothetical protein
MAWTHKPDAVITAEVATDESILDEIIPFVQENPLPRWKFHQGPPHPPRSKGEQSLQWYWDRGHPFIINRDQDGLLWGVRILSRNGKHILWLHFRRTPDEDHGPLGDNPHGGVDPNHWQVMTHSRALQWAVSGVVDAEGENLKPALESKNTKKLIEEQWENLIPETMELYRNVYGPMYGREV